jgi:hypothetical protein
VSLITVELVVTLALAVILFGDGRLDRGELSPAGSGVAPSGSGVYDYRVLAAGPCGRGLGGSQ